MPNVASVNQELCSGCGVCEPICPYTAIVLEARNGGRVAKVEATKCKGCGACAAACPSGAMTQLGFEDKQIIPQLEVLAKGR